MDLQAFRSSFQVLGKGHALLIAAEGTRSGDGRLQRGKHGTAYTASRADVPLVPMTIIGSDHFRSCLSQLRRTPVRIILGPTFRLRKPGRVVGRKAIHQMTEELMYQVARLMPRERRGVYADLSRATEGYIIFEPMDTEPAPGRIERVAPAIGG